MKKRHQLYRYYRAFDLLILDEPDSFPYRGNPVLHGIAETSCRGHRIYLTATPDEELKQAAAEGRIKELRLDQRPHGHPLPEPLLFHAPILILLFRLIRWIREHQDHPRIIFVPTIRIALHMHRFLNLMFPCNVCTSETEDRDQVIEDFRNEPAGMILATTVLERGVTISRADVCVWQADHPVFDEAGLVQMAGRAGRSAECPDGDVLFLLSEKSRIAEQCLKEIREANLSCAV